MVSELAGEGAMPLPKPASHAELQGRLRRRIRSSLRRGVFPAKTVALFNLNTMFIPLSLDGSSRSRSVEILSRVLIGHRFKGFDRSSRRRFAESTSVELVDHSPVAVPGADPWKAGANCSLILNNSWSRVIVVVLSPQRRTREMSAELVTIDRSSRNRSAENSSAELAVAVSSFLDSDFACVDYFSDIDESIAGFMDYERNFVPGIDYAERFISQSLSTAAREDCIQWMLKVLRYYIFRPLTVYLAINYFDRLLYSRRLPINGWLLQLLSVACLSLAAKMKEPLVPYLLDLQVEGAKYIFEPKTIRRMEFLVLTVLDWRLRNMIQTERIFLLVYRQVDKAVCT
nr:cyclin-D1-1 [Ipomoea batatas]